MEKETAMKILKELHDNSLFSNRIALETIIPELADGNDERIRKDIIAYIKKANGEPYNVLPSGSYCVLEMITWLEKQGEQKPILDFKASNWYVSKVDGKIHDMTYNPTDKVEPRFKVKYAGSEYNVLEVKDIAGVTFYGIEDEPNHIDYVKAENCEIISGYAIKENGSPYPTKPAVFSEKKSAAWSEEDENYLQSAENACEYQYGKNTSTILWLKSIKDRMKGKED